MTLPTPTPSCREKRSRLRGRTITKWSATAHTIERLPSLLKTALRECFVGRPGVVHLDIPENVVNGKAKQVPIGSVAMPSYGPGAVSSIESHAKLLAGAKLPVIQILMPGGLPPNRALAYGAVTKPNLGVEFGVKSSGHSCSGKFPIP